MLVRVVCAAAVAASGFAPAPIAFAASGAMAKTDAPCPETVALHPATLPATAWADVAFPKDEEQELRAKANLSGAVTPPSLRVYRVDPQDHHRVSVVAEKSGSGWTLSTVEEKGGKVTSRKDKLRPDRAAALNRILADDCFYDEPTDYNSQGAEATCMDAVDFYLEAVGEKRHRTAIQRCAPAGLTGQAAEILWNQAAIDS